MHNYILLLKILSCVYTSMESMAVFDEISGVHTKKSKCAVSVCKTVSSVLKCACLFIRQVALINDKLKLNFNMYN